MSQQPQQHQFVTNNNLSPSNPSQVVLPAMAVTSKAAAATANGQQGNNLHKTTGGGIVTSIVQVPNGANNVVNTVMAGAQQQQQQQQMPATVNATNADGTTTTIELSGDTVQLMGMANQLPTGNLYVNYPHTMWQKDADGNRIPVQFVKQETGTAVSVPISGTVVTQNDLLSQATAQIKTEPGASSANNGAMTIRTVAGGTPAGAATSNANSVIVMSPPSAATAASASTVGGQVIPTPPRKQPTQLGPDGNPLPRPHACDLCSKTFVKREHLTKHLRIHKNDNKRYSCEYCQKAFRDRYELVRHTRRHTGDFPFR